jgi:exopolysaccharide production protein ExoQ
MAALPLSLACAVIVAMLLRGERRVHPQASPALWIPWAWLVLASSRALSDWLGVGAPRGSVEAFADGSPIDRAAYLALMAAGLVVLARRRLPWADVAAVNKLLLAYGLYCAASTLWADVPAIAARRLVKDSGNLVMALIVLSEPAPWRAAALLLRRVAIVLLPASLLFVLAYPELGTNRRLDGSVMYTGVTNQKNELGRLCLVTGIALLWLMWHDRVAQAKLPRLDRWATAALATLALGLLVLSESRTALACLLLGAGLLLAVRLPVLRARPARVVVAAVGAVVVLAVADLAFGVRDELLAMFGRDPTLTHRTGIWRTLLAMPTQPALGEGFMSFWSGPRLQAIWTTLQAGIVQAHNGYLEQYLNLGVVGVGFMVGLFTLGLLGARAQMQHDVPGGLLRLVFLASAALYNVSEAAFHGQTSVWWLTLLGLVDTRALRRGDR